ncbi:MAG: hypothetical protein QOI15_860, partial [Pseudonocardiales bacterium]|nr:hypothetical protein [Pseudonocardiales bacterium]
MATRMRIAAAACVVASGLLVGGAGAALAVAGPEAGQSGETGDPQVDPAGGASTAPTPVVGTTIATTPAATPTVTAPKPTSELGDGRNGLAVTAVEATPSAQSSSKQFAPTEQASPQTDPVATGEP